MTPIYLIRQILSRNVNRLSPFLEEIDIFVEICARTARARKTTTKSRLSTFQFGTDGAENDLTSGLHFLRTVRSRFNLEIYITGVLRKGCIRIGILEIVDPYPHHCWSYLRTVVAVDCFIGRK